MSILIDKPRLIFLLNSKNSTYAFQIVKSGIPAHLYWGKKLRNVNAENILVYKDRAFSPHHDLGDKSYSLDLIPQEYPAYGHGDFRIPAYQVELEDGTCVSELKYKGYKTVKGKPALEGLPATYVENEDESDTVIIEMYDEVIGLTAYLSYTVYSQLDVITRSVKFVNNSDSNIILNNALSMSIDFTHYNYDFMQLSGSWARERHIYRQPLRPGLQSVESRRGASSHQHNPFIALLSKDANEVSGEVYGISLVYSGNFVAQAEVDQYSTTRVSIGINPHNFKWTLECKETFQTPEAVMVYSSNGLGEMSRTFHRLYRTRLCRGQFKEKSRPVLINNWEGTYFDFNADKIEAIAKVGQDLGIELFVLDDGWFGVRNDDTTSLGDWFVNKDKLPGGLKDLGDRINKLNMKFGLWFEPEMVSPKSELYTFHPDWCLHVPNRTRSEGRNQLILDLSRKDVQDYIISAICSVLESAPIEYVKWDMNRHMTDVASALLPSNRQKETAHRYMLGLYRVLEEITSRNPKVLFESCSGGGGRFDPGILYYMPQTWTSDNTDAVDRLKIQYGTSIVYPASSMGAHVSAVPNHQVGRITPLKTRGDVAMSGNFGYELDLTSLTELEKEEIREQVNQYKKLRDLIQFGDMYRLSSPFEGNTTAWMFVSQGKNTAFVACFRVLDIANRPLESLKLQGLDEDKDYFISGLNGLLGGDELMYAGLWVGDITGDYQSKIWYLEAKC